MDLDHFPSPPKLAPKVARQARASYELAVLHVITRALELGGFPPADALTRAREIRAEEAAWATR